MIGSNLGRYNIIKLLGQGSMALVYEAYDPMIDRNLAIKVLREECCLDPEYRARFLREAKSAGNLSHPHIVTVHDIGEAINRPYIVMELLKGTTLEDMLKFGQALSISDTIEIGIQLASALHYAHESGIVHRDIKPSNIVCTNVSEEKINVKLTDFGIAHVTDSNLTHGTDTGALLGTPYYISPEQVLGSTIDGRADLFSLGITLYHLSCGQRPFVGSNVHTLLFQIATDDHRPITHIKTDFPLQLKTVIDKCLQKDPDDRYQSGHALVSDLKSALEDIHKRGAKIAKSRLYSSVQKQTLLVSALLLITMTIAAFAVIYAQRISLQQDIKQHGISLSQYVAHQNTEAVVRQDWLAVELFIQHMGSLEQLQRISITDHQGIIRGDTLGTAVGTQHVPLTSNQSGQNTSKQQNSVLVYSRQSNEPIVYAGFTLPTWMNTILQLNRYSEFHSAMSFGQRRVGKVIISLSPKMSYHALLNTLSIILLLYLVCVLTVVPVVFYISRANVRSLKLLQDSMNSIASGNYTQRIDSVPLNETGETYIAYNNMADKIQQRDIQDLTIQRQAL